MTQIPPAMDGYIHLSGHSIPPAVSFERDRRLLDHARQCFA
ncbi:MAG: hypothetical protein ACE15B_22575 [Bryobacteraceae bacterium]